MYNSLRSLLVSAQVEFAENIALPLVDTMVTSQVEANSLTHLNNIVLKSV